MSNTFLKLACSLSKTINNNAPIRACCPTIKLCQGQLLSDTTERSSKGNPTNADDIGGTLQSAFALNHRESQNSYFTHRHIHIHEQHPANQLFHPLPSGRRFRSIKTGTIRFRSCPTRVSNVGSSDLNSDALPTELHPPFIII